MGQVKQTMSGVWEASDKWSAPPRGKKVSVEAQPLKKIAAGES